MTFKYLVASLAIGLSTSAFASPDLPRHADLDLKTARLLADSALSNCSGTVSVLDRGGNLLVTLRGDGIGPHNTAASQRKAYTALSTKTPTRLFAERARSNPETVNLNTLDELLLLGGGIPALNWSAPWAWPAPAAVNKTKAVPSRPRKRPA